jgi:2-oxo-4-hydroxy-4-carboxy-5-ureidoimidazoline decarboxylase
MESWRRLDLASRDEARTLLAACCGSTRWVDAMLARRPFGSATALVESAASIWRGLSQADWLEAFSHHPKIGDKGADGVAGVSNPVSLPRPRKSSANSPRPIASTKHGSATSS